MTPLEIERWQRISELLNDVLEREEHQRGAFLQHACRGDPELRAEVEALLAAHQDSGPVDALAEELLSPLLLRLHSLPDPLDVSVYQYRLIAELQGGGMGIVYRAVDTRLDRPVALKFLAPRLGRDPAAKRRFLQEAQAAARLEHPNICTIYEVGETEAGELFIAMPLYDGETLRERIERGPLPVQEAVDIALQTAQGLAKAHGRGIVHRDIKPGNLIITSDGIVKIVDFGIAKLADVDLTHPGHQPGTAAYMSPEQARGQSLDHRTDLWSLGVVLYEMLAGTRPFAGASDSVVLHAVLHAEPAPLTHHRPEVPRVLARLVAKALAHHPQDRFTTAREMARELESLRAEQAGAPRASEPVRRSSFVLVGGERRQATVVVSCLSGWAGLAEALPPQEVERITGRIRAAVTQITDRHGGSVNRFSGEEIVLVFGVPTTHEDDCFRATRAALELHTWVRELDAGMDTGNAGPLRLHTGIDTGQVAAHASDDAAPAHRITGTTPRVAAQLAALAPPDEVWITPECQRLIGPFFTVDPRELVRLRDRAKPLIPYRVGGESGLQTRLEAAGKVGLTEHTGREEELDHLHRCLAEVCAGEGRFVTVVGEAGLGKSRLLHEFRQGLRMSGERVTLLRGRCQSYGTGTAYLPFLEALRELLYVEEPPGPDPVEHTVARIRDLGGELDEFIPLYLHLLSITSDRYPVPKHLHGEQFRLALQEAFAAILTVSAGQHPTVLLLEDWHWADEASHAVLRQVAEMVPSHPLMVVVTCRPDQVVEWGNPGNHSSVALRPLALPGSVAMLRSILHVDEVPEDLGVLIHERSGGNPFFLEEICQTLREEDALRVEHGRVILRDTPDGLRLPDTVQGVIRTRLDHLDQAARETARLASVVGREFTRRVLAHAMDEAHHLPGSLEALKSAGLIQQTHVIPEATFRFKHVLMQEVAYASLLEHQRRELHGRVGAAIEQLYEARIGDSSDRLAHHFSRAEQWRSAVRYGVQSAERAEALSQFSEAIGILERTAGWLARMPASAERDRMEAEILLRRERLSETLGMRVEQQRIIDQLIALLEPADDPDLLAEAYLREGDLYTLLRRFDEAEAALSKSLRIRQDRADADGERHTLRSLGLLRWHQNRNREALQFIGEALEISRRRQDTDAIAGDLSNLGQVLKSMGAYERARTHLEEALELCEERAARDPGAAAVLQRSYILHNLANVHRELGDNAGALEHLRRARNLTIDRRLPIQLSFHFTAEAHMLLQQGEVEESLRLYGEAVELTRRARFVPGLAQALRARGEVLLGLGRRDEALPCLAEAATLFAQLADPPAEADMWCSIAGIHEERTEPPEALAAWGRARALRAVVNDAAGELHAVEGIARVTRRHVAEPSLAKPYYDEALALAERLGDRAAEGRLRNAIGILEWGRGRYEAALAQYEAALAAFRELGEARGAGLMLNSLGVTLHSLGRWDEARDRLEEALALHRSIGERVLEGHALAALGEVRAACGDSAGAVECYELSLAVRREIGDRTGEGWMLHRLARLHLAWALPEQAHAYAAAAARIAADLDDLELAEACEQLRRTPPL